MRTALTSSATLASVIVAVSGLLLLGGCSREAPVAPPSASKAAPSVSIDRYESVRGRITSLPDPTSPTDQGLRIHHEEMPEFKGRTGSLGMREMVMPFPLGPGVSLEGFAAGDPVEFDFEVQWEGSPPYYITAIRPLPQGVELNLQTEQRQMQEHNTPEGDGPGGA
jgi:hypothetical protein